MKVALIYSGNGLDVDVLYNLIYLYERLGYKVVYSNEYIPCQLIIFPRPTNETVLPNFFEVNNIHVYNYVGLDLTKFFYDNMPKLVNCLYICTSETLIPKSSVVPEGIRIINAMPPVYPELWRKKISNYTKYSIVHIGNMKPYIESGEDKYANNFLNSLRLLNVKVWGRDWKKVSNINCAGVLEVTQVSQVYVRSNVGLGLMYPFQRDNTFSGRFWHGPLNGCSIISEPNLYSNSIPGVHTTDLSSKTIEHVIKSENFVRSQIQEESSVFWQNNANRLEELIINNDSTINYTTKNRFQSTYYYMSKLDNVMRACTRFSRGIFKYV